MNPAQREIDKLYDHVVADLARRRRGGGVKLNHGHAAALISEGILARAGDGRTLTECTDLGMKIVATEGLVPGVHEMPTPRRIEAALTDGTQLGFRHQAMDA